MTEEADAPRPQSVHGMSRIQPLAQHHPRRIAVEERAGDGAVRDARARQGTRNLGNAAGRAVREPLPGRHPLVVDRSRRLEIEDDDGRMGRQHNRKYLRRGRVRRRVDQDEIDPRCAEGFPRASRRLYGIDEPGRDDLGAHTLETGLDPMLISL